MNIIEEVQKNLGFSALDKIDPNTQEATGKDATIGNAGLAQAGIPAILLGIYNSLESDPGVALLESKQNLLDLIFGKSKDIVVKRIEAYAKFPDQHSEQQLEHIASESIRVIHEKTGEHADEQTIRAFVAKNKPDTLLYLPPSLELGKILQNNNLDDRTGKMEGPISSFMHSVEKAFNTTE